MTARRRSALSALLLAISLCVSLLSLHTTISVDHNDLRFYVFTDIECKGCVSAVQPLLTKYGGNVTIYDSRIPRNADRFARIVGLVGLEASAIPLVGAFGNGRLTAITSGAYSLEQWNEIAKAEYDGVHVYVGGETTPLKVIKDQNVRDSLSRLFRDVPLDDELDNTDLLTNIVPMVIMAAVADAVNPCEFYALIVFLSLVFFRVGRKAVLGTGISFSLAVFTIYFLMGLGLLGFIAHVQEAKLLIVILGFTVGLHIILNFVFGILGLSLGLRDMLGTFLGKTRGRIPRFFYEKLQSRLRVKSESPLMAFAVGAVASLFLLPCTSGSYFIAASLISSLETRLQGLFLLSVYNSIVAAPFVAITLGIYTLKFRTVELKRWSDRKQKWLNFFAGLLMVLLSLYLLLSIVLGPPWLADPNHVRPKG